MGATSYKQSYRTANVSSPPCTGQEHCFNPRPPRKVGANVGIIGQKLVSILAHLERWALPATASGRDTPSCMFQSSPTSKGGRYVGGTSPHGCRCFNPRPPRKVGATSTASKGRRQIGSSLGVSILAHLERWALLGLCVQDRRQRGVSILAHLERWALPSTRLGCMAPRKVGARVSILAHLERWALLSAPLPFHLERWAMLSVESFNPRPPRKVGATTERRTAPTAGLD